MSKTKKVTGIFLVAFHVKVQCFKRLLASRVLPSPFTTGLAFSRAHH